MKTNTDHLIDQLRELDPARGDGPEDTSPPELLTSILAADPLEPAPAERDRPIRSRRLSRRRFGFAVAAAAVAAGLFLAIGLPSGGGGVGGASSALSQVATAAAAQPPAAAGLPYRYLKTRVFDLTTSVSHHRSWSVYEPQLREEWAAADGSGRVRTVYEAPRFVGPGDREAWEAAGEVPFLVHGFSGHEEAEDVATGVLRARADVSSLPTEPDALAAQIGREAGKAEGSVPSAAQSMELIAEDLRDPAASPELRKALYEAAIEIPGIEYLGASTDPSGRRGVAVGVVSSYSGGRTLYSLIYDPRTTAVLATEQTALEPVSFADGEPPLVLASTEYLDSAGVSSLSAAP